MPLNFGKWLGSLGYKTDDQPPIVLTAQPVVLVGDHRTLVSQPRRACGVVGGRQTSTLAVDFPAIQCITPVDVLCHLHVGCTVAGDFALQIGAAVPLVGGVTLVPQPFGVFDAPDQIEARWQTGTVVIADALPVTQPRYRVPNNNSVELGDVVVPAGQVLTIVGDNAGGGIASFWVEFFELPSRLPR